MSLRTRLAITFVAFFALALIALEIGTYLFVRQTLISGIDDGLRLRAEVLQQDFNDSNKPVRVYFGDQRVLMVPFRGIVTTDSFAQVFDGEGQLQLISPNLPQALPVEQARIDAALAGGDAGPQTVTVQGLRMRELLVPLRLGNRIVGALYVVRPLEETDRALQIVLYALGAGGTIVLLAAARGGVWLTRAAVRPIDEITRTAQSIVRAEDLSRRVPVPEPMDELHRLAVTINELLARLEAMFGAQRRFVADVSHELRTPLAAMQGNLDVLSRGAARDPELLAESIADMRSEVNRLIRMANDLLLLAQSDSGVQLRHEPVELDTLLLEVHRELRSLADGVQLRLGHEDQVTILGDRDRIKQALLNLVVNALQHTPPGGTVTLSLDRDDGFARLSVVDTGAGIASENLSLIFERFYRGDRSRTRSAGAGLGLPIVKWIADAHGGRVEVWSGVGEGSTFALLLPLPPQPLAPRPARAQPADVLTNGAPVL